MRENCNGAAVCRVDSSNNAKAVGKWDRSVTARSDGTALELKLAPENGCTVVFNVMCDRDATSDALSFLEETGHCNIRYLFSSLIGYIHFASRFQWYTNQTCTGENVSLKSEKGAHVGLWFFLIILISGSAFFIWKKGAPIVDSVRGRFRTISVTLLAWFLYFLINTISTINWQTTTKTAMTYFLKLKTSTTRSSRSFQTRWWIVRR